MRHSLLLILQCQISNSLIVHILYKNTFDSNVLMFRQSYSFIYALVVRVFQNQPTSLHTYLYSLHSHDGHLSQIDAHHFLTSVNDFWNCPRTKSSSIKVAPLRIAVLKLASVGLLAQVSIFPCAQMVLWSIAS